MQEDLDRLSNWFSWNKLTINLAKCENLNIGHPKPNCLKIFGSPITNKNQCKYLGFILDNKLTFREHIAYIEKKNKFCGLMYKVRHLYPTKYLLLFYNAYVKSIINYGLLVYGRAAKTNLERIELAQRRIIRAIFFKRKYDSLQEIIHKHRIFTVFELFVVEVFNEVFRQLTSKSPLSCFHENRWFL